MLGPEIVQVALCVGAFALVHLGLYFALERVISWFRNALIVELQRAGEVIELGPESGHYRGSNARSFPRVKGNAVIVLTDKRLCIRRLVGRSTDIVCARIVDVREDVWFLGAMCNFLPHLIVRLREGGEVGFFVTTQSHKKWLAALRALPDGPHTHPPD